MVSQVIQVGRSCLQISQRSTFSAVANVRVVLNSQNLFQKIREIFLKAKSYLVLFFHRLERQFLSAPKTQGCDLSSKRHAPWVNSLQFPLPKGLIPKYRLEAFYNIRKFSGPSLPKVLVLDETPTLSQSPSQPLSVCVSGTTASPSRNSSPTAKPPSSHFQTPSSNDGAKSPSCHSPKRDARSASLLHQSPNRRSGSETIDQLGLVFLQEGRDSSEDDACSFVDKAYSSGQVTRSPSQPEVPGLPPLYPLAQKPNSMNSSNTEACLPFSRSSPEYEEATLNIIHSLPKRVRLAFDDLD